MAIAKQQLSVSRGYKVKAKPGTKRQVNGMRRSLTSFLQNAREVRAFITDEIVYATMDTLRVMNYVRYQLGFQTRTHVEPVVQELEHFVHTYDLVQDIVPSGSDHVGVLTKQQAKS